MIVGVNYDAFYIILMRKYYKIRYNGREMFNPDANSYGAKKLVSNKNKNITVGESKI